MAKKMSVAQMLEYAAHGKSINGTDCIGSYLWIAAKEHCKDGIAFHIFYVHDPHGEDVSYQYDAKDYASAKEWLEDMVCDFEDEENGFLCPA